MSDGAGGSNSDQDIANLSVKELKQLIERHGESIRGITEKDELRRLAMTLVGSIDTDGVDCVGERTREQRDAELRAAAVDLTSSLARVSEELRAHRTIKEEGVPRDAKRSRCADTTEEPLRHERRAGAEQDRQYAEAAARSKAEAEAEKLQRAQKLQRDAKEQEDKQRAEAAARSKADAEEQKLKHAQKLQRDAKEQEDKQRAEAAARSKAEAAAERQAKAPPPPHPRPQPAPPPPPPPPPGGRGDVRFRGTRHTGRTFKEVMMGEPGFVRWAMEQDKLFGELAHFVAYVRQERGVPTPGASSSHAPPRTSASQPRPPPAQQNGANLNEADVAALTQIPGIGQKLATQIVQTRTAGGDFHSFQDAADCVCGLGEGKMQLLQMVFPRCTPTSRGCM